MAVDLQSQFRLPEYVSKPTTILPAIPSTPTSPEDESFDIRIITEKDSEAVLNLLKKFFFKDEPLNLAIKLIDDKNPTCPELEQYSVKDIDDGTSLMIVSSTGKVIGVCLNATILKGEMFEEEECDHSKFSKILKILTYAGNEAGKAIKEKYPHIDKIFYSKIISVDDAWRGRGIGTILMDATQNLAKKKGYKMMRADCTSHYSAKILQKLGYTCVYTMKYADYTDNGKPVFEPEEPHTEFAVYVLEL